MTGSKSVTANVKASRHHDVMTLYEKPLPKLGGKTLWTIVVYSNVTFHNANLKYSTLRYLVVYINNYVPRITWEHCSIYLSVLTHCIVSFPRPEA